jgi:hypothetical protein
LEFRITSHSGLASSARSADAIDLLWDRLQRGGGAVDDDVSFARVGNQIAVTWGPQVEASPERRERSEIGRAAVLNIVRQACEQAPAELEFNWFAVGFIR